VIERTLSVVAIIARGKKVWEIGLSSNIIITRSGGPIHLKVRFSPDQTMHKSIDADMLREHPMGESH